MSPAESEAYLELATANWISSGASQIDNHYRNPLRVLSAILLANHEEHWLSDFLQAAPSVAAAKLLQTAITSNASGDSERALVDAVAAESMFRNRGNIPGRSRAFLEEIYSLHRQSKGKECKGAAAKLRKLISGRKYRWIETQLAIESSTCEEMLGNFDRTSTLLRVAEASAQTARYPALQLRITGMQASVLTITGRFSLAWEKNKEGLEVFWNGVYPSERGFQFLSDLEFVAEDESLWYTALALEQEAISLISMTRHRDVEAIAHFRAGGIAERIGDLEIARFEFEQAASLFSALPSNSTTQSYRADAQIALAQLEAKNGEITSAEARLQNLDRILSQIKNFTIALRYFKASAEIARRKGDPVREQHFIQKEITIGEKGFRSLHTHSARWEWRRQVGEAYLRLLEIESAQPHQPWQLFYRWERYRNITMVSESGAALHSDRTETAEQVLRGTIAKLRNTSSIVAYAILPNYVIVWVANQREFHEVYVSVRSAEISRLVSSFYELCSNSDSDIAKVRQVGLRLYEVLVQPVSKWLVMSSTLIVDADGPLAMIPWSALTTESGRYLAEVWEVTQVTSLIPAKGGHGNHRRLSLLAVEPGSVRLENRQYPPLEAAHREVAFIATLFERKRVLQGIEATKRNVLKDLTRYQLLHFAGHAENEERGGRLVMEGTGNEAVIRAEDIAALHLDNSRLVVLSACSTAGRTGEPRDPYGLVHAFLSAGTLEVVASRWAVDSEATFTFMQAFYRSYTNGVSTLGSLRIAATHLLNTKVTSHPFYWAAFAEFTATAE